MWPTSAAGVGVFRSLDWFGCHDFFNASGGTVTGVAFARAAANSYRHMSNSFVGKVTAGSPNVALIDVADDSFTGDNTLTIAVWGAQVEIAAASRYFFNSPSSPLQLARATETRAADVLTIAVPSRI